MLTDFGRGLSRLSDQREMVAMIGGTGGVADQTHFSECAIVSILHCEVRYITSSKGSKQCLVRRE